MIQKISVTLLTFMLFFSQFVQAEISESVNPDLLVENQTIEAGKPFWVAINFKLEKGWHIYWKNPGDSGMAPTIEWTIPGGYQINQVAWPTPTKYVTKEAITYGYDDQATILVSITSSDKIADVSQIECDLMWVACDAGNCLPGNAHLTAKADANGTIAAARENQPISSENILLNMADDQLTLTIETKSEIERAEFYPDMEGLPEQISPAKLIEQGQYQFNFTTNSELKGVVALFEKNSSKPIVAYELNGYELSGNEKGITFLVFALGFAFLGGLILNLMPCVLPVISLKVLSFIKMADSHPKIIFKHSAYFAGGVIISFWILSAILLLLKIWGHSVGWGFQLQEPLFVAGLAAIFFVLALSLFGVFELGTGLAAKAGQMQTQTNSSFTSSFLSGILATAVATPCSGPFLGYAIGLAFTLPSIQSMLIFTTIGFGMASPYLLMGAFPSFLKYLPKPGNWMITFKELMGFLMLATVLWLVWVFAAQTDMQALFLLFISFLFLAIACWIFGKWGAPFRKKRVRIYGRMFTIVFACLSIYILMLGLEPMQEPEFDDFDNEIALVDPSESKSGWEKFSPKRLAELREKGVPVFIDFTAKWCILCQNNHRILTSRAVVEKFSEAGVVKMKADWTKRDEIISKELQKFNRSSVPLYVLYNSTPNSEPTILPQIITTGSIINMLEDL